MLKNKTNNILIKILATQSKFNSVKTITIQNLKEIA
jgi:hypothetical protein